MSEYVLINAILCSIFGFAWSTRGMLNCSAKTAFFGMVVWSGYLMFGPANLVAHFTK